MYMFMSNESKKLKDTEFQEFMYTNNSKKIN